MKAQEQRASLLQRALAVFILIAASLGVFLWAGKSLIERPMQGVYLDSQRLKALRTFEHAIVPLGSVSNYESPSADTVRSQFAFCEDSLKPRGRAATARRGNNPCAGATPAEELACYLRTINTRLEEMAGDKQKTHEGARDGVLSARYVVDVERWTEGIRSGSVTCKDALGAARQVAARDGRLLGLFAWRELTPRKVAAANFAPGQSIKVPARVLEQRNPWSGVPGCIYYGGTGGSPLLYVTDKRQSNRLSCLAMRPREITEKNVSGVLMRTAFDANSIPAKRGAADRISSFAPPDSLDVILEDLNNIRLPWKDLFRAYTELPVDASELKTIPGLANKPVAASHGPNQLERLKHRVDAGFNVHLTIDPATQQVVQDTSACYSGDVAACQRLGLDKDKVFGELTKLMYEKAAVRMAAVALIDIPSGRIEALGSAHSDCYRQEYDGPGRNARDCPQLPTVPHYEPDRLLNHALYTDALPGSIIKPIMAAGFLRDAKYRTKVTSEKLSSAGFVRLQDELKSSDSIAFLNRMFCADKGFTNCERPAQIQKAAVQFGWDQGCDEASFRCGRLNVLFGHADSGRVRTDSMRPPLGASVLYGRLLVEPASDKRLADMQMISDFRFDPAVAAACARGDFYKGTAEKKGWRKCHNRRIVYLESEGWGQGNARTTPVGAAGMLARLGAAANGQEAVRLPYLVDRISNAQAKTFELAAHQFHLTDPVKIELPQADAALIVQGLVSHKGYGMPAGSRGGTAHSACLRVFDAAACNQIDWIAGKTGTPPYGNDDLTLKEIREKCAVLPAGSTRSERADTVASCNHELPYKWYVAMFRTDDSKPGYNKAIAVLTERNWYRSGPKAGKVQSPGDKEANISAEMAIRIMARLRLPNPVPAPASIPPSGKT